MALAIHEQKSDQSRFWFDAGVVENGDGSVTISATTIYVRGEAHPVASYTTPSLTGAVFRIVFERAAPPDYLLDLTGEGEPLEFPGVGAPLVVWRDPDDPDIHVLRSVPDA